MCSTNNNRNIPNKLQTSDILYTTNTNKNKNKNLTFSTSKSSPVSNILNDGFIIQKINVVTFQALQICQSMVHLYCQPPFKIIKITEHYLKLRIISKFLAVSFQMKAQQMKFLIKITNKIT